MAGYRKRGDMTDDECVGTPSLYNLVTPLLSSQVLPVMRRPLNRLMASFISCLSPWRAKYNVDLYISRGEDNCANHGPTFKAKYDTIYDWEEK